MKTISILILIAILSCSNDDDNGVEEDSKCTHSELILTLEEPIQAIVKSPEVGQPFYSGKKIFYEVDAEEYLPTIFEQNGVKTVRIFSKSNIEEKEGTQVQIKGAISNCLTGDHGLLTNDLIGFYLITIE